MELHSFQITKSKFLSNFKIRNKTMATDKLPLQLMQKLQIRRFHRFHLHLYPHPHRRPAIFGDANETIGHTPEGLSKVVTRALKKEIELSVEAEVTGHRRDAAERKWTLGGGIEVPYICRFYGPKKSKVKFRNKLNK